MQQVVVIHGGSSFNSYERYVDTLRTSAIDYERLKKSQKWRDWLSDELTDFDVLLPTFPNGSNANYDEWTIYFEKLLPLLDGDVSLVGHSLGAMFLAKYLHEHQLSRKVRRVILVSPCYNDESGEDLGGFKITSATGIERSTDEVHIFHSKDDPISPFTELAKFTKDIPDATLHIFDDRNHFLQPTFPELAELLKQK